MDGRMVVVANSGDDEADGDAASCVEMRDAAAVCDAVIVVAAVVID